jgi:hypothetical protein
LSKNLYLPIIYKDNKKTTKKSLTDFYYKHNKGIQFRINQITIFENDKFSLSFNDFYNNISKRKFQKLTFKPTKFIEIMKFCLTGKNEMSGHLMDKGIKYVETIFSVNDEKYNIRIFPEHTYKIFLIKLRYNNKFPKVKSEDVILTCNGLKEFQEKITSFLKSIFNLPKDITIPQYLRLFFLGDENSLLRIISDKGYHGMRSLLMNYLIGEVERRCKLNPENMLKLSDENNEKLIFFNYSKNFIEEKISRLRRLEEIEINEIRNHYINEINQSINLKISKTKREIAKIKEEQFRQKKHIKTIERLLNPDYSHDENQFLLFEEGKSCSTNNKDILKEKLKESKAILDKTSLNLNYLEPTLKELRKERKSIAIKYRQKIDDIISDYQDRILKEKVKLEELTEEMRSFQKNIVPNLEGTKEIRIRIKKSLEKSINYYVNSVYPDYRMEFDRDFIPLFHTTEGSYLNIDSIEEKNRIPLSLAFHLGLSEFFHNFPGILPSLFLLNLTKNYISSIKDLQSLIKEFYNRNSEKKYQIIIMSQLISKLVSK